MTELFLKIVNMSISALWLVLAVLMARLLLKKAPRWIHVVLWGIVAVRLICPFTPESVLSLIPSAETVPPSILTDDSPQIHSGISVLNSVVNPVIGSTFSPAPGDSVNPLQIWLPVLCGIWLLGIAVMVIYTAVSYLRLRSRVKTAIVLEDNIFQSEYVASPFILGIAKPRIYLPFALNEQDMRHVIAHENAHIRRRDHWWKPLGFLLLTLHWFNPLMWVAYILLCRDIELACDEKVIKELDMDDRADYSQALLACSVSRRSIAVCPLAFGEVGVKERVKSVLNYKKPAFWIIVIAVVVCIIVAVCFLTDPKTGFSSELPRYVALEELPGDYSLRQAKLDGCVVMENGDITSGKEVWQTFIAATKQGQRAQVRYVNYYAPRPSASYGDDYNDYPKMYVHDLTFDGTRYTARWYHYTQENIRTYRYLLHLTGKAESPSATFQAYDRYVLTNEKGVNWEDIFAGMVSSQAGAGIDHLSIYTDYIYDDPPSYAELQKAADDMAADRSEYGIAGIYVDGENHCLHMEVYGFSDKLYAFISRHIPLKHVHISLVSG